MATRLADAVCMYVYECMYMNLCMYLFIYLFR